MTKVEFVNHVLPLKTKLFGFACSFLPNSQEAEDVVQESMVKLWEENKPMEHYASLQAWLFRVVRNRCLDLLKRKGRRQVEVTEQVTLQSFGASPEDAMHHNDTLDFARQLVEELPEKQKQLFRLRHQEEMSYEELSQATGMDMSQVKVYLYRARKTLKEKLEQRELYGIQSA